MRWRLAGLALVLLAACGRSGPLSQQQAQVAINDWLVVLSGRPTLVPAPDAREWLVKAQIQRMQSSGVEVTGGSFSEILRLAGDPKSNIITVTGVRDVPADSSAVADLDMSRFHWWPDGRFHVTAKVATGQATFRHNTDGRWVVETVTWDRDTTLSLIRFRRHLPKGGNDGTQGIKQGQPAGAAASQ